VNPKTQQPPRTQQAPRTRQTSRTRQPQQPQQPQRAPQTPRAWLASLRWRAVHWGWEAAQRAGVVTADTPAGRRFAAFGPGSMTAFPPGSVFGEASIAIGADTLIGALVTMSAGMVPGQDLGPVPVLRIGDRCVIGRGSHIVAHHSLVIENDVFTGPYVYITDQNHGYADPDAPIGLQLPHNAAVRIGSGSWLGAGAIVLPGACIGRNVVIAAGSVVRGTIPDQCVAAGVPARVVRRYHPGTGWSPSTSSPSTSSSSSSSSAAAAVTDDLAVAFSTRVAERVDGIAQASDPLR
jgi:carbonic anhydrase/acetyltransferase-like protein (isoleucine patch superfamily)